MQSTWCTAFLFLFLAIDVALSQSDYSVKLIGGTGIGNGTLKVWRYSKWYYVCHRYWNIDEARVVCRQLGFPDNAPVTLSNDETVHSNRYFDNYYISCQSTETHLSQCSRSYGHHSYYNCHYAVVTCSNITTSTFRLAGGSSANKGRVELWSGYSWVPITTSTWTSAEAKVICRQLGLVDGVISYGSSSGYTRARYGQSQSTACYKVAQCSGWEPMYSDCGEHFLSSYCPHDHDVSVECHPNRQNIECHCLTSSKCSFTTGSCPDDQCSVGWAGDYCQIELPRLTAPPQIIFEEPNNSSSTSPIVRWDEWSFDDDMGIGGPVIGYSIHYVDMSQLGYKEVLVDDVETTSYRLDNLPPGRNYDVGISCLIKTGAVTSRGPLSPTVNFTTPRENTRLDFVLLNYNPMIQLDNAESSLKIGGYAIGEDRTNNINFGRRVDSGTGVDGHELGWLDNGVLQTNDSMFPVQSVVLQTPLYDFTGLLLQLPASISAENIGAFYSWATIGLLSTNVTTFTISKEVCPYGTFGADCKSTCHCKFGACDRSKGCWNITCDNGFHGPQCQEYKDSTPCPDGFYGTLCQYKCHCSLKDKCYKNGTCPLGCQEGWGGDDCQFAIPALRNPPRISKSNFHSLHIEWDNWRVHHDYGLGTVTGYRLFYRYTTPSPGAQRTGEYTLKTKLILSQINPCRRYEIYIRAYRNISGELVGGRPSPTVYHDMACNYGSVEVTLMTQPAAVDMENKSEDMKIAVYSGALSTSIQLGRTCDTGAGNTGRPVSWFDGSPFPGSHVLPTMVFPRNTLIETIVTYKYHALVAKIPGESFKAKGGAFSAEILGTWALPSKSSVIVLDKDANPRPTCRSIVVGTGDRVVLSVVVLEGNTTGLRWRHNGREGIKQWKDKGTVIIEHVRTEDSGIYECFFLAKRNRGKHAIIQLNVKDCPLSKYGPACDLDCPVCYNGGICDSVTSSCICPSGFTGSDCSVVCKNGSWGQDCSLNCNNENNGCLGNLFCPATPLGCSCLPGFQGADCKEVCADGFYGADCKQVCNCPSSSCDPVLGCALGTCCPGYGGPQCQEHIGNVSCNNGTFGPLCNHHCHCKHANSCHDNGTCKDGVCGDGWAGHDCHIALPYLAYGPTLSVSKNRREIFVSWFDWTFGRDFGTGPVVLYEIFYKDAINGNYTMAGTTETTDFLLNKLRPGKQYIVYINCLKDVDGLLVSGPASPSSAVSTCRLTDLY
ncbi:uncharacterized protein LOC117101906 [Anneissia japonica]|uniref:uncharacterized protein LOC117101906 n=1 Tax=Anneissia japonica TaxID=1529436 RepID=UPI0014259BC4|nr:uncharacterized protein LOC117101906 [Anneissia japonica]